MNSDFLSPSLIGKLGTQSEVINHFQLAALSSFGSEYMYARMLRYLLDPSMRHNTCAKETFASQ